MASLKQNLKQKLIDRQHKLYAKEVAAKNLTYDSWIREREKCLEIDSSILAKRKKSLTNDLEMVIFGSTQNENAGNHSKKSELCQLVEFVDENRQSMKKGTGILVSNDLFCRNMESFFEKADIDIIFLSVYEGEVSEIAYSMVYHEFTSNENIILIYGDEDTQEESIRENPWFKPDWSPDRFLSCFYFGGLVAVRMAALKAAYASCRERAAQIIQGQANVDILYMLLFEMLKMQNAFVKGHDKVKIPVCHIPQVLYHSAKNGYEQIKDSKLPELAVKEFETQKASEGGTQKQDGEEAVLLSVIIPSKDNPDVLFHCLDSLLKRTDTDYTYEIILVDNGSSEENRKRIADKIRQLNQSLIAGSQEKASGNLNSKNAESGFIGGKYLYEPMTFNFSRMCNQGAAAAKGRLLLFLNDDIEIIQPDWMNLMIKKALLPYAGAVGAKLLYPDSDTIQHAGITNLRVGPAHKLQFLSDEKVHYFGMNKGVHDMLAVTGACLMVKREVFDQAGGFCEELAVAFNDVDLCYTIYEQGYYNIVRNDVVLYHHESLSRGKDGESQEKQLRLLREKDVLYERHQEIYGWDPFYHPYLTTDMLESEYSPAYRYQVTLDMPWCEVKNAGGLMERAREDQCLVVGMECAMDIYKWQYGVSPEKGKIKVKPEDMGYYFQGYSFVIGSDNACYKKKLLLRNRDNKGIWAIPVEDRYRQDIKKNLKDQLNVDLTGFAAKMRREDIPAGIYQFGMLAEDKCSRQKLVNWSNWVLEVIQ